MSGRLPMRINRIQFTLRNKLNQSPIANPQRTIISRTVVFAVTTMAVTWDKHWQHFRLLLSTFLHKPQSISHSTLISGIPEISCPDYALQLPDPITLLGFGV